MPSMKRKHGKQGSHKGRLVTAALLLMALAGVAVMLLPTVSDRYRRWQAQQEIARYTQVVEGQGNDYSSLWTAAEEYNRRLAETGTFSGSVGAEETLEVSQLLNPLGTGMMGYVDIPKINVHLPIYQGTQESALQAGAGFWIGTSLPTGGESTHCVLTAHNGLVRAKMFTDLDQLEIGDTFSLSVLDRVLTYEVDQILVVEPDDLEPLQIVDGEDFVTLYTCTPYGVNTHRLLVRGRRIPTSEEPEQSISESNDKDWHFPVEQAFFWGLVGFSSLLILLALRIIFRHFKPRSPKRHLRPRKDNPNPKEKRRLDHEEKP